MGAIPSVGKREGALATIRGSVPSPEQMPQGCRFAPRCPFAEQRCIDAAPPDKPIAGVHRVACWLAPVEQFAQAANADHAAPSRREVA
jgi:peptide/nickel transport system ATP-binding protein